MTEAELSHSMYVTVGRQRLRVSLAGEDTGQPPLLLINGIGATGDLYQPLRAHFTGIETIAFDAPGVHKSPAPLLPMTMRQLAGVLAGMVHELGHKQVDVLGVSWGGALAQEMAWRHPATVRRLVLAATTPGWTGQIGRPSALALLMTPARYYSPAYLRRVAPTLYGGAILDHPDLLEEHAFQRSHQPPSPRGYLYQLAAIQTWTSSHYLGYLPQRTLVLAGDDDPIIPLANGQAIARAIPDSHLHVLEGGGHLFLFTRAEETAALVQDFLAE